MGHLPDPQLHKWSDRDALSAAILNHDFGALHGLAEMAADLAATPDPEVAKALARVARIEGRISALEHYTTSTPRQRGEREFTPLASFATLLQQVNELAAPLREAAAEAADRRHAEQVLESRLALVESTPLPPPAPSVAEFEQLQAELEEARAEASAASQRADQLRTDLAELRSHLETGEREKTTRFVPLPAFAALQQRLEAFQAVAASVEAMRAEIARLQQLVADTDRREVLQRQFTPRSAFAYLLRRVERLEGRPT